MFRLVADCNPLVPLVAVARMIHVAKPVAFQMEVPSTSWRRMDFRFRELFSPVRSDCIACVWLLGAKERLRIAVKVVEDVIL